jgi:hypothetical protein
MSKELFDRIRKRILEYYYDQNLQTPGILSPCDFLIAEFGISEELFGANVLFLVEELLIDGSYINGLPARGLYRITNFGIKAVENPNQYLGNIQFLQLFLGDVTNSTVIQGQTVNIENSFNEAYKYIEENCLPTELIADLIRLEDELKKSIEKVTKGEVPDTNIIWGTIQKIKAFDRVFVIVAPVISQYLAKIFLGT